MADEQIAGADTQPSVTAIEGKNGGTLTPWQKGVSGNPSGVPKDDISAKLARLAFAALHSEPKPHDCPEKRWANAKKLAAQALKNPKFYQVLSDRAFQKLKIPVEHTNPLESLTEEQLLERLRQLRAKDGMAG